MRGDYKANYAVQLQAYYDEAMVPLVEHPGHPCPIFLANQRVRAPSPSRVSDERAAPVSSFLCAPRNRVAPLTAPGGPLKRPSLLDMRKME